MCKECKGHKEYRSFDELPQELKELYKGRETKYSKDAYVDFINKLNAKGDKLVSDYANATTKVRIHYGKCGHTHPEGEGVKPDKYKSGRGCGICRGFIVVEGDNDLATKRPELAKEWHPTKNGDLKPTRVTCGSRKKVWWLCLDCGYEWEATIGSRTSYDTSCSNCGDGIKYPEKVLAILLDSLKIKFKKQLKFDGYRFLYDFYLIDYGIIIEVHGRQHYNLQRHHNWKSYEEEHENDLIKYDIAVLNGYEYNKNYFIIDARESNIKWLRNSINNCLFFQQFDLSNINWQEIDIKAQKSKKIEVCRYWKEQKEVNKDLTAAIVAKIFNIDKTTIRDWLTWGNENGLCIYSGKDEFEARIKRVSKFIYLIKPDGTKWYDEAMSQRELARLTGITAATISLHREDGTPLLNGNNAKYDSKYIGSYVVEEDKLEEFLLNLKGGDIIE